MGIEHNQARPRVAVIGTGGTFAMHGRHRFDWAEYAESNVLHPISQLLGEMDELGLDVELIPVTFRALGSTAIEPKDWLELAQLIRRTVDEDPSISGVVVTHGTATLEETAWFLDLTLGLRVGVVVTGAQRPANTAGSDVPGNLRAAITVAIEPEARHAGVLVVLDNQAHAAREVTKASSFELAAFESPGFGPLAVIDSDTRVRWRRLPADAGDSLTFDLPDLHALPRVDIALSYAGSDGAAVQGLRQAGAQAIVVAGLAPGRPAQGEVGALRAAASEGVLIVMSSRAARGHVPPQAFLQREGWLAGSDLAPAKLRILLMLALSQSHDRDVIQQWISHA